MSKTREDYVKVPYEVLPDGFNLQEVMTKVINEYFAPKTAYQLRCRNPHPVITGANFTAVQGHGGFIRGRFYLEENKIVVELSSKRLINEATKGRILKGLTKIVRGEDLE